MEASDAFCRSCGASIASSLPPPPISPMPAYDQPGAHGRSSAHAFDRTPTKTNTLAIVALVAAFLFWPAGIICGVIARQQIRTTGEAGDGMALAGIIISVAVAVLTTLFIILFVFLFSHLLSCGGLPAPVTIGLGSASFTCGHGIWQH
jgi:uncharacterized BrkB/YihY/UPF0761 family membrane protein